MASDRVVERRKVFKQYKEDVKERGKPFYPYAMLHDTIMSLFVVVVIITLAVVWKWTIPGNQASSRAIRPRSPPAGRAALRQAGRPGHRPASSPGPTGISTSSSTCCGCSSGRTR